MSECVVRMTLPKACVWRDDKGHIKMCPLYWEDEARCQGKDGKKAPWYDGKRPDWCPIICSLPEGHGELIERQPIIQFIEDGLNRGEYGHDQIEVMTEVFVAETIVPADTAERGEE